MIKRNGGVTLVVLTITVVIILIITGMIVYSAQDSIYVMNIDGQIGKTVILNAIGFEKGYFKEEYKMN